MMQIRKNNKDKFIRVSDEIHDGLKSIKEIKDCSFSDVVAYLFKKYEETNGEIRIALINEYFNEVKKIFKDDGETYGKIDIMRSYLIKKLKNVDDAEEILKQNLIYNNSYKSIESVMTDNTRRKKGLDNDIKVTKKSKMIEAVVQSETKKGVEYRVEIAITNDDKMYVFCSCPDFQVSGMLCKHLWKIIYDEHLEKYVPEKTKSNDEIHEELNKIRKMMDV